MSGPAGSNLDSSMDLGSFMEIRELLVRKQYHTVSRSNRSRALFKRGHSAHRNELNTVNNQSSFPNLVIFCRSIKPLCSPTCSPPVLLLYPEEEADIWRPCKDSSNPFVVVESSRSSRFKMSQDSAEKQEVQRPSSTQPDSTEEESDEGIVGCTDAAVV